MEQFDFAAAIAEGPAHIAGAVAGAKHDPAQAQVAQPIEDPTQEGALGHGGQHLGLVEPGGGQPGAETASQNRGRTPSRRVLHEARHHVHRPGSQRIRVRRDLKIPVRHIGENPDAKFRPTGFCREPQRNWAGSGGRAGQNHPPLGGSCRVPASFVTAACEEAWPKCRTHPGH